MAKTATNAVLTEAVLEGIAEDPDMASAGPPQENELSLVKPVHRFTSEVLRCIAPRLPANHRPQFLDRLLLLPALRSGLAPGLTALRYRTKRSWRQTELLCQISVACFVTTRRVVPNLFVERMTSFG